MYIAKSYCEVMGYIAPLPSFGASAADEFSLTSIHNLFKELILFVPFYNKYKKLMYRIKYNLPNELYFVQLLILKNKHGCDFCLPIIKSYLAYSNNINDYINDLIQSYTSSISLVSFSLQNPLRTILSKLAYENYFPDDIFTNNYKITIGDDVPITIEQILKNSQYTMVEDRYGHFIYNIEYSWWSDDLNSFINIDLIYEIINYLIGEINMKYRLKYYLESNAFWKNFDIDKYWTIAINI